MDTVKCLVCKKEFSGDVCPRCDFPVVYFIGDPDEGIREMLPQINAHRKEFLGKIETGIIASYWKDKDGYIVADREERKSFGYAGNIAGKTIWLPDKFARIPDVKDLAVRAYVKIKENSRTVDVTIPNLTGAELQQIGIKVEDTMSFSLVIKNSKTESRSGSYSLLD